jgi:thymidylate synthase ThyX
MSESARKVYLLNPRELSPETIAVTFAKTSRSPESFKEIAAELTEAKSAEFNEKWVVGYGHSSVAEHAVLHFALENLSRLAVETIQSSRLASFTEKSTRYQKWDADAYHVPVELIDSEYLDDYRNTCQMLFQTYERAIECCHDTAMCDCPQNEDEKENAYERRLKPYVVDACRFLLPASSLANVGMTINAREIEHLVSKMLSHPLTEVRMAGNEIKEVSQAEVPTLVKYAQRNDYFEFVNGRMSVPRESYYPPTGLTCELVHSTEGGDDEFLAALLFRFSLSSYQACMDEVMDMTDLEKLDLAKKALGTMGKFDWPLRETEHITYTFDVVLDQGAYYEVKRHRMMTQTPQELTCSLGYDTPSLIERAGFASEYGFAMDTAAIAFEKLAAWNPTVAGYLVPNGFHRRVLLTLNFREAFNFIQLRSASSAHFSVRRVAQQMAEQIRQAHPILGEYLRSNSLETSESISQKYFSL